ncbi:CysB family HTH-type transcriptional regulator [Mitsuaria sp. TWR114]|jgi:LysR family transcriptional regulator, cys regulon transcriptional activator|uniref:CysB family HTH-type transcriptional regulator n=1 Tax=unclassified Roseateles TaxID=2626991 RepID=UPI0011BEC968|nr:MULTISPECIES: CysB family HTH-type transcriptional regulator [unclassified Roseateles]MBB3283832.1 LysR family cys regulon transcriptional activator [Mitsuaria sp. BK037]MBB3295872.1 LysR family cys regulon transcriptional activator [Mitsuaria sp. BK041]MBB3365088.1 LysR family cys regulon transcriptional activator [Mitsuaria sp. BK045]TXD87215.1 CysB family HTH-type transcriptional regulator [Mitsuaria sp. TWR114]
MNLQQLRIVREAVQQNFNLTEVAAALFTSQSGVSKHIKDLEDELGVELFQRRGKRLLGLTEPGKELAVVVDRMLQDVRNIKRLAQQFSSADQGQLTIATTHTQARYALPQVVARFKAAYPRVHLVLHQGSPSEIVSLLQSGEADIGIATEALGKDDAFVTFPFYEWRHAVVVPEGHALTRQPLTLEALAEQPLITYHEGYTGRARIDASFAAAGLAPDVVMSALDADVIKTYVQIGLGVGVIAAMAFEPGRDSGLQLIDASHLFPPNTTRIALKRGHYLRGFAYRFLQECVAELTEDAVREAMDPDA